jgi:hypothetical protein
VLVTADTPRLHIELDWGDYRRIVPPAAIPAEPAATASDTAADPDEDAATGEYWQREPCRATVTLDLPPAGQSLRRDRPLPVDPRLTLACNVRPLPPFGDERLPPGARVVSLFLSNARGDTADLARRDEHYVFQPILTVTSPTPLLPQPNLRGRSAASEWDERLADLHYRDVHSYAVGHGVATTAVQEPGGSCYTVRTEWIPEAAVEFVAPAPIAGVERSMDALAELPAAALQSALQPLVSGYRAWLVEQQIQLPALCAPHQTIGQELLHRARQAADRIAAGIATLADPVVLRVICVNRHCDFAPHRPHPAHRQRR